MANKVSLLLLLLLLLPGPAAAENEEDLLFYGDSVVSTPSRRPQPISESPVPVTVLTREDIARSGARTLPEVLELAVGVNVIRRAEAGYDVSLRGFNGSGSDKVLVMLDGRPLFNLADSSVDWRMIPVPISAIERVEVVRGPGSALYGENAFLGTINIITVRGVDGGSASAWSGAGGSGGGSVAFGNPGFIITNTRNYFNRYADVNVPNALLDTRDASPSSPRVLIQNGFFSVPLSQDRSACVTGGYAQVDTAGEDEDVVDRMAFGAVDYRANSGGVDWQFGVRVLGQDRALEGTTDYPGPYQRFMRVDADMRGVWAPGGNHVVVAGVTGSVRSIMDRLYLAEENDTFGDRVVSMFIEDQLALADKTVFLTAGGRVDVYANLPAIYSPRVGVIYSPAHRHSLKAGWGQASRVPNYYDLYGHRPVEPFFTFLGNERLRPERVDSYHLSYLYQQPGHASLSVDLYYQELSDLIISELVSSSATSRVYRLQNQDRARSQGLEIEGRVRLSPRYELLANYALNDSSYDYGGKRIEAPFSPRHQANIALQYAQPRLNVMVWAHYVGRQVGVGEDTPFVERALINDYATVSARVEYVFIPDGLSVALYHSNLLGGSHYESPLSAPVTPGFFVEVTMGPEYK